MVCIEYLYQHTIYEIYKKNHLAINHNSVNNRHYVCYV